MGSIQIDLIKSKLELIQTLLSDAVIICEQEGKNSGDGWYSMETQSLKIVGSMIQMEYENIDRHEKMMLAMNDPVAAKAILEEAKASSNTGRFNVDDRIQDALRELGVELKIEKIDPKDKLQ